MRASKVLIVACLASLGPVACFTAEENEIASAGTDAVATSSATDGASSTDTMDPTMDSTMDPTADPTTDPTGDTGSTGEVPTLDCASYCDIYMNTCSDFAAYANDQECMDHCGQWPMGSEADTAGDTLGCRLYHVTVASTSDPAVHCPHSAPNGAEVCVDEAAPTCVDYCDTYFDGCMADKNVYVDMADCMTQCAPWYPGITGDTAGNSIGCRTYHSGAPAAGDPTTHCPHAGPGGAGVCVFEG